MFHLFIGGVWLVIVFAINTYFDVLEVSGTLHYDTIFFILLFFESDLFSLVAFRVDDFPMLNWWIVQLEHCWYVCSNLFLTYCHPFPASTPLCRIIYYSLAYPMEPNFLHPVSLESRAHNLLSPTPQSGRETINPGFAYWVYFFRSSFLAALSLLPFLDSAYTAMRSNKQIGYLQWFEGRDEQCFLTSIPV